MGRRSINHLGRDIGLRVWFGRTQSMAHAHTHQDIEFNYVLEGQMSYLMAGQMRTIAPGQLGAIWGSMPHQTVPASTGTKLAWGTLPMGGTLLTSLPRSFVQQLLGQGMAVDSTQDPGDLLLFQRWEKDLSQAGSSRRELVAREMELRLHRMALNLADAPRRRGRPSPASLSISAGQGFDRVVRMAAFIAEHYEQPITAADVADAASLHPNYAMTLFRRHAGATINAYLTRQRIAHAQRLLVTTADPILEIGLDSGFGSPSRFFEAFRHHAGCSPRAYRQRLTGR